MQPLPEKVEVRLPRKSLPRWLRVLRRIAVSLLCLVLLTLVFIPLLFVLGITRPVRYRNRKGCREVHTPETFGLTAHDRLLTTGDGHRVWTSRVDADNPRGIVILLTGIRRPPVTWYYGHAAWLREQGYSSMLLELRAHGRSSGGRIGLGFTETSDVQAAVNAIRSLPGYRQVPILLQGVSMGAAVAINALSAIPDIMGAVAESPYSSVTQLAQDIFIRFDAPGWFVRLEGKLVAMILFLLYGEASETMNPIDRIGGLERPLMMIASAADTGVPVENACRLLNDANSLCRLWIREGDAHLIVREEDMLRIDRDSEYCDRLLAFYNCITEG